MKRGLDWLTSAFKFFATFSAPPKDPVGDAAPAPSTGADSSGELAPAEAPPPDAAIAAVEPEMPIRIDAPPEQDDGEHRREVVRELFNGFWRDIDDKPATFAERLDAAEDYINDRLAERNVGWRLDAGTREQLGLPRSRLPARSPLQS